MQIEPTGFTPLHCKDCREGAGLDFSITMAFQAIVDVQERRIHAYEALVRGTRGEGAGEILARVNDSNRYRFDQVCRVKAIELAARLGLHQLADCRLHINFLPNAVYRAETCIRATLQAAAEFGFPTDRIVFEVTEGEKVRDEAHLQSIFNEYRRRGFATAIDDFGAGYAGLNLLANFQPDIIKLDMALTRNIHLDRARRAIVAGVLQTCRELDIAAVAEGVETREELNMLQKLGVRYVQGYLFGKPALEQLESLRFDWDR